MNRLISTISSELRPEGYALFFRGQLLVLTGYLIAMAETIIAIELGLTQITMHDTMWISFSVLSTSLIMTVIVYFKKKILIWQEWLFFSFYVIIYLFFYCVWIYKLHDLRILGLLNALIAVTIVLSYTSMLQSLIMSLSTLACHFSVIWYAMNNSNQNVMWRREIFLSACLFPTFILISVAAYYIKIKRQQLSNAKSELELVNNELNDANAMLRFEHSRSLIEMDLAHDIQSAFFPSSPPNTDDWDVALISKPYSGVSGDFYDFYYTGTKLDGISLFDVSGHGVAPALITILAKPVFYRHFMSGLNENFGRIFEAANLDLIEELENVNIFITAMMVRFSGNEVEYINAGHPDMFYKNFSSGTVSKIVDKKGESKGHPIGIGKTGIDYKAIKFSVSSGDMLILYSDCFLDCRNCNGEHYGDKRLAGSIAAAAGNTSKEILDSIVDDFCKFTDGTNLSDDLTLIVARKK